VQPRDVFTFQKPRLCVDRKEKDKQNFNLLSNIFRKSTSKASKVFANLHLHAAFGMEELCGCLPLIAGSRVEKVKTLKRF
jgi:hypothetical protein